MAAVRAARQVGPGEVIYLRIAQNYYEILKKTTTKLQQTKTYIYSNSVSAAITTLNIDFMWRDKDMKKQKRKEKKRKEKRHTKQLCKRRYESTGASEAGGPRLMDPVEPNTPQFFFII